MTFNSKFSRIIALCLCICMCMSVLASCDALGGTENPPEGTPGDGQTPVTPPGADNSGDKNDDNKEDEKKDPVYSEKGIFFSSLAEDGGDGSLERPYNSFDNLSKLEITSGTYIYIERGSKFLGSLGLYNLHGSEDEPIVVTTYGKGAAPIFDGNDLQGSGVLRIANCSNIVVENLDITDSATTEGDRRGVLITCDNNKGTEELVTYKNIKLKNLYIHDIHGILDAENSGMSMESKITGGIHVWSNDGLGRIDGLEISECQITEVSNVGIATWYHVAKSKDGVISVKKVNPYNDNFKDYAHLNVHIDGNEINYIGKNAIFARHMYGGLIENNVIHDTAIYCVSGNTIVTSYVDGTIIQYNEGYRNMAKVNENTGKLQDGCMLDADLASKDTIWQYNYSHDNSFGLFLNCTYNDDKFQDKVIVRYNLSVNDKGNKGIIYINYVSDGIYVYNNTIVTGYDTKCIIQSNDNRTSYFYNNIIYNRSATATFEVSKKSGVVAESNLIFNEYGSSISGVDYFKSINAGGMYDVDPMFVGYLQEDSIIGINNQNTYMLDPNSPALGVGKKIEMIPDFFGNEWKKSIGFYCGK